MFHKTVQSNLGVGSEETDEIIAGARRPDAHL
jgi:hypothetical protein